MNRNPTLLALCLAAALAGCSDTPETLLQSAQKYLAQNNARAAIIQIKNALQISPNRPDARFFLGRVLLESGDPAGAEVELRRAMTLQYTSDAVVPTLAKALLAQGKAKKLVDEFGDAQLTLAPAQADLQLSLSHAYGMQHRDEQSEAALQAALRTAPAHSPVQLGHARVLARLHRYDHAQTVLDALISLDPANPDAWKLKGDAYTQSGSQHLAEAEGAYRTALAIKPDYQPAQVGLVQTLLNRKDVNGAQQAIAPLQKTAPDSPHTQYLMAFMGGLVQQHQYAKALAALNALDQKKPDLPVSAYLRGTVLLRMNDATAARKSLERAISLNARYFPAIRSLVTMDLAEHQPNTARKRYEALLKAEPTHLLALLGMAELAGSTNAPPTEVAAWLNKAVSSNPSSKEARLALIAFHLSNKDPARALGIAQAANTAFPDDADVLDALGQSQQANGNANQAIGTYDQLAKLQPQSVLPYWRMADVQMVAMRKSAAIASLQHALQLQSDFLPAQQALAAIYVKDKRWAEALELARTLQRQHPTDDLGYRMEADIAQSSEGWSKAAAALQNGLKQTGSPRMAIQLLTLLQQSDQGPRAEAFATSWLKDHPDDALFRFHLGDQALLRKDYSAAEQHYQAVLRLQPNNASALNNLAWVSGLQNHGEAIGYAEKAVALAPNQPDFLDTLASLHARQGHPQQALELQRRALAMDPRNALFKLNLAGMLLQAGKRSEAQKLADEMVAAGDNFAEPDKLQSLRQELAKP